jgi:hypothetical protein
MKMFTKPPEEEGSCKWMILTLPVWDTTKGPGRCHSAPKNTTTQEGLQSNSEDSVHEDRSEETVLQSYSGEETGRKSNSVKKQMLGIKFILSLLFSSIYS